MAECFEPDERTDDDPSQADQFWKVQRHQCYSSPLQLQKHLTLFLLANLLGHPSPYLSRRQPGCIFFHPLEYWRLTKQFKYLLIIAFQLPACRCMPDGSGIVEIASALVVEARLSCTGNARTFIPCLWLCYAVCYDRWNDT
jgi:hypothetical protein